MHRAKLFVVMIIQWAFTGTWPKFRKAPVYFLDEILKWAPSKQSFPSEQDSRTRRHLGDPSVPLNFSTELCFRGMRLRTCLQQQANMCLSQIAFWAERRFALKQQCTNFSNGVAVRFCLREFDD